MYQILTAPVLANSGVASILTLLHAYQLRQREQNPDACYSWPGDILIVGVVANYAAVAADTFSSELGILSKSKPRLITSFNLRQVPPGTNGGVTAYGLAAGLLGSMIIVATSVLLIPFCSPNTTKLIGLSGPRGWTLMERQRFAFAMSLWGALGSVLDSVLGGLLQQSVVDTRTGRIVEGEGGKTVLVSKAGPNSMHLKKRAELKARLLHGEGKDGMGLQAKDDSSISAQIEEALNHKMGVIEREDPQKHSRQSSSNEKPSRVVESGALGILDNNEVNFLMALTMSLGAMGIASWFWDVPFSSILSF